jgi:hypothetical protein
MLHGGRAVASRNEKGERRKRGAQNYCEAIQTRTLQRTSARAALLQIISRPICKYHAELPHHAWYNTALLFKMPDSLGAIGRAAVASFLACAIPSFHIHPGELLLTCDPAPQAHGRTPAQRLVQNCSSAIGCMIQATAPHASVVAAGARRGFACHAKRTALLPAAYKNLTHDLFALCSPYLLRSCQRTS